MSEQSETTDPADLPFGAPFAAWAGEHLTADRVLRATPDEQRECCKVLTRHARRRESAGLSEAMEDLLDLALRRLCDLASQRANLAASLVRDLGRLSPTGTFGIDTRELVSRDGALSNARDNLNAVVDAYVATADKLATIGDEERTRVAQRHADSRKRREVALLAQPLETLRAIAAKAGAEASGARKGPYVDAILQREFAEVQS